MRHVLSVPVGFVSDHVEVLYDIDIKARAHARALGVRLERVPMLNDDPLFIESAGGDRRGARGRVAARIGGRGVMHIAVVGGGVTGLAAALRLLRRAPGAEVTLFEKQERLGGEIHTERVDGFVIEAGADSFLTRKARGVGLCEELGLAGRLVARQAQHAGTFVRHGGALHPLPEGLTGMIPTRIDALTESALAVTRGARGARGRMPRCPCRATCARSRSPSS